MSLCHMVYDSITKMGALRGETAFILLLFLWLLGTDSAFCGVKTIFIILGVLRA